ncbi:thioesterase II family protein [Streptomyces palmae]|uniref:thioesterase II family protein n=1 Tax=Streptomyces palmae TaxID=1701085 RepID=UPI001FD830C1|nr:alpha/beta fold hydrolase [Streptomyces palmae]
MTHDDDKWIRRFQPAAADAVQLVCFPYAGGSASYYFPLAKALAPGIEVAAVQYPGRQERYREPCIDDLAALADAVYPSVRELADRPLAFFGHSMGAVLAFEVALRLEERAGVKLEVLFTSGRRAPSRHKESDHVHLRDDAGVISEMRALEGTESAVLQDPELMQLVLPALRADYRAIETYRGAPDASVTCPMVTLTGDADPRVEVDEARAWEQHTSGGFDFRVLSGGHFFLNDHLPALTEMIKDRLGA